MTKKLYNWKTRNGRWLDIRTMELDHFHNLVVYLHVESARHNPKLFQLYWPVIQEELIERNLSLQAIISEGVRAYVDSKGIERIWDELTNTELAKS